MLAVTHLVVSLLLIQLLTLDRNDAFVALLFGVFVDFDHFLGLHSHAKTNGLSAVLDIDSLMDPGGQWKSMFHNPVAIAVVGPLSVASRLAIPLLFWGAHISMDYLEDNFLGLFSASEAVLLFVTTLGFLSVRYAKYIESYSLATLGEYLRFEWSGLARLFRSSASASL